MRKQNKKVQIPLLIVIPPMGSSTPRLVWSAGMFEKVNRQSNLWVMMMMISITRKCVLEKFDILSKILERVNCSEKQAKYFDWEYLVGATAILGTWIWKLKLVHTISGQLMKIIWGERSFVIFLWQILPKNFTLMFFPAYFHSNVRIFSKTSCGDNDVD